MYKKLANKYKIEIIIIFVYVFMYTVITIFHEPWFDEAQAWQIGKCATYRDMLFVIPHTEGHPPLWSLILSVPAKLGVPFELGLKSVAFIFSVLNICLIEFKAPFPKGVKFALPFTYYLFYQYGVISRTYCVMTFAIILIAITFKSKNEKPWWFCMSCFLLCLTSAYGILIAGGICLVWGIEVLRDIVSNNKKIGDKRIISLGVLLVFAVLLILQILPYSDTAAVTNRGVEGIELSRIVYMLFAMLGDSVVSVIGLPMFFSDFDFTIFSSILISVIIVLYLYKKCSLKSVFYLMATYIPFAIMGCYYLSDHHLGIAFLLLLLVFWIGLESDWGKSTAYEKKEYSAYFKICEKLIVIVPFVSLLVCSAYSMGVDLFNSYCGARQISEIIEKHGMKDAIILDQWCHYDYDSDAYETAELYEGYNIFDLEYYDTNHPANAMQISAYFDDNIFVNFNSGEKNKMYVTHFRPSIEENLKSYEIWRNDGIPEVIIGDVRTDLVYEDGFCSGDYIIIEKIDECKVFKCSSEKRSILIKMRKDVLEKFGYTK